MRVAPVRPALVVSTQRSIRGLHGARPGRKPPPISQAESQGDRATQPQRQRRRRAVSTVVLSPYGSSKALQRTGSCVRHAGGGKQGDGMVASRGTRGGRTAHMVAREHGALRGAKCGELSSGCESYAQQPPYCRWEGGGLHERGRFAWIQSECEGRQGLRATARRRCCVRIRGQGEAAGRARLACHPQGQWTCGISTWAVVRRGDRRRGRLEVRGAVSSCPQTTRKAIRSGASK